MSSLIKNVSALLEKSELLIEDASTRDEILKADKMLNHYRWKSAIEIFPVARYHAIAKYSLSALFQILSPIFFGTASHQVYS